MAPLNLASLRPAVKETIPRHSSSRSAKSFKSIVSSIFSRKSVASSDKTSDPASQQVRPERPPPPFPSRPEPEPPLTRRIKPRKRFVQKIGTFLCVSANPDDSSSSDGDNEPPVRSLLQPKRTGMDIRPSSLRSHSGKSRLVKGGMQMDGDKRIYVPKSACRGHSATTGSQATKPQRGSATTLASRKRTKPRRKPGSSLSGRTYRDPGPKSGSLAREESNPREALEFSNQWNYSSETLKEDPSVSGVVSWIQGVPDKFFVPSKTIPGRRPNPKIRTPYSAGSIEPNTEVRIPRPSTSSSRSHRSSSSRSNRPYSGSSTATLTDAFAPRPSSKAPIKRAASSHSSPCR